MNTTNNLVDYDQLFIVIKKTKFVIYERENNEIVPESKVVLDNFLKALNRKGYSYFLRYGWTSAFFLFLGILLMIILPIFQKADFLWIPIIFFLIGFFLIILYKHLRKKFAEKIKDTYYFHKRKIEKFYSIFYSGTFSKSNFSLTPKKKQGHTLNSNNNILIMNQRNINPNTNRQNRNERILNNPNRIQRTPTNEFNYPDINGNSSGRISIYNIKKVEEYPDSEINEKLLS